MALPNKIVLEYTNGDKRTFENDQKPDDPLDIKKLKQARRLLSEHIADVERDD